MIPYSTMIKENSRKWRSDDRKVMNWEYHEADDYYVNPQGVRFNFKRYAYRNDKYKFHRDFKMYQAEKYDVETVFGNLKAYLGFKRFTVRGLKKVKRQIGIALMALNMKKMAGKPFICKQSITIRIEKIK